MFFIPTSIKSKLKNILYLKYENIVFIIHHNGIKNYKLKLIDIIYNFLKVPEIYKILGPHKKKICECYFFLVLRCAFKI